MRLALRRTDAETGGEFRYNFQIICDGFQSVKGAAGLRIARKGCRGTGDTSLSAAVDVQTVASNCVRGGLLLA
ncbi:hypothetical protein AOQ72_11440 [Bradyrhizobium yuanmingense]|uniref:Uncharacterized protein n=1 Tax=Bradyrhizobium yuanmingense TaxID=108015 RepID=A0A0R3CX44_9BRAD|nr:hypothetical protein AOQ72_11440 [Bradyrhizobium yuanmingense]